MQTASSLLVLGRAQTWMGLLAGALLGARALSWWFRTRVLLRPGSRGPWTKLQKWARVRAFFCSLVDVVDRGRG